ncbi:MAG: roadblock/LC7 domain-containing protein [Candidatus Freyarchaeota archaeon]|nr:roadblock/LC7 domain-containing protein [Candidatus Freyarchaeota archaeon]
MTESRLEALTKILENLNSKGGFNASIIAGEDGLVMAEATKELDKNVIAAMAGLSHSTAEKVKDQIGLGDVENVIIETNGGVLVFRGIYLPANKLILAVIMPSEKKKSRLRDAANILLHKDRRYERIIDEAVNEIINIFST